MKTLETKTAKPATGLTKIWQLVPVWVKAIVLGFLVNTIGVINIPIFSSYLPLPAAIIAIPTFLFLYFKFFSGSWGHKASKEARKRYFRVNTLSPAQWRWSLFAAVLLVILFQAGVVVTFRFIKFPAEQFTSVYGLDALPVGIAWTAIVLASLSAGLCEETGFRGYGQVPLEERYGPVVAILIGSILFMLAHLHQAWAPPVLLHIFGGAVLIGILAYTSGSLIPGIIAHTILDIINFSYWWSDVAGKFEYQTIAQTGVDAHLIISTAVFVSATTLFFLTIHKIKTLRTQNDNKQIILEGTKPTY
jgi:membrane protease YdiL (CAAX protease family)